MRKQLQYYENAFFIRMIVLSCPMMISSDSSSLNINNYLYKKFQVKR